MQLNVLSDNQGARKSKMRVGRGIGSGKGKTSGRGQKGQGSREGVAMNGFEGGQTPLYRRLPTKGFSNFVFKKVYAILTLERLQAAVDSKKIDASKPVSFMSLKQAGVINNGKDGLKIVAKGEIKTALKIELAKCTAGAKAAIEKAGGEIRIIEVKSFEGKIPSKNQEANPSRLEKKNNAKI